LQCGKCGKWRDGIDKETHEKYGDAEDSADLESDFECEKRTDPERRVTCSDSEDIWPDDWEADQGPQGADQGGEDQVPDDNVDEENYHSEGEEEEDSESKYKIQLSKKGAENKKVSKEPEKNISKKNISKEPVKESKKVNESKKIIQKTVVKSPKTVKPALKKAPVKKTAAPVKKTAKEPAQKKTTVQTIPVKPIKFFNAAAAPKSVEFVKTAALKAYYEVFGKKNLAKL
jgi:hypothetical protein